MLGKPPRLPPLQTERSTWLCGGEDTVGKMLVSSCTTSVHHLPLWGHKKK